MDLSRLLIVSNRLPYTVRQTAEGVSLTPATGGLATGLRRWHERSSGLWIGWPGDLSAFPLVQREQAEREFRGRHIVPVELSKEQIDRYYHGFANQVLWPLFHYLIDRVPVDATGWDVYREVNERFASAVASHYQPGDTIWVHDYQLMLVPALLRQRLPEARIGFFLHIPFPSSEVFRIVPWRRQILDGLLGADLLGFHTFAYLRHFVASLLHVSGIEADIDRVRVDGREIRLGVYPMGIDAEHLASLARDPEVASRAAQITRDAGGRRILLGVDRLDYTKGIPRRLQAVERLLQRHPQLSDEVRFIQVAVPSRDEVDSYQRFKRQVEQGVGRINGACGTLRSTPVHYVQQLLSEKDLAALYLAADVMLVTPLRDGMNLVAKEFVASRVDGDGVLILSEFAGAACELDGAVLVNPYDVDAVAAAIQRTLAMTIDERRARMTSLRRRVEEYDVHAWASEFLQHLCACGCRTIPRAHRTVAPLSNVLQTTVQNGPVRLLLDYDGTLVPLARAPELAAPDAELLTLLDQLCRCPFVEPAIVSGRPHRTLEAWFDRLPLMLWAEHGFWRRASPESEWIAAAPLDPDWTAKILPILEHFTARTPGSRIERKSAAVTWHFRGAQRDYGARQAHELRMLLGDALSNQPLEVLEGKKVIEIRFRGISKAVVAHEAPAERGRRITVAFGDDRTDEDLFRALPESSITVAVGRDLAGARYRVNDHREVRQLLRSFIESSKVA
jgi:trehalose 6-phosphate synthase/phosphatase